MIYYQPTCTHTPHTQCTHSVYMQHMCVFVRVCITKNKRENRIIKVNQREDRVCSGRTIITVHVAPSTVTT